MNRAKLIQDIHIAFDKYAEREINMAELQHEIETVINEFADDIMKSLKEMDEILGRNK